MPAKRHSYLEWTPERLEALIQLRKEGKSLREIGAAFGVNHCAIVSTIKRYDLDRTEVQYWRGVETRTKVLDRLSISPAKNKELRELTGVKTSQMFRILKDMMRAKLVRRERHGYYGMVPRKKRED